MTNEMIEQSVLLEIADSLCAAQKAVFVDRNETGAIGFIVCRDTPDAREIIEDTPAFIEERGASLIITVKHP